jgi:hypothetical protein
VLASFQDVEDKLAALDLLAQEASLQQEAVKAAQQSAAIAVNQYKAGTANYLAVVVLQASALNSERTALGIQARRLAASVGLVKALGGGWDQPSSPRRRTDQAASATAKSHAVFARTSSTVTPGCSSLRTRPDGSTSKTHRSVMIMLTTPLPVIGNVHALRIFDEPSLAACSISTMTLLTPDTRSIAPPGP